MYEFSVGHRTHFFDISTHRHIDMSYRTRFTLHPLTPDIERNILNLSKIEIVPFSLFVARCHVELDLSYRSISTTTYQ